MMTIEPLKASQIDEMVQKRVNTLFTQLNATLKQRPLREIFEQGNDVFIVCCRDKDEIIGIASMAIYTVISGYKGMVEDVVVDSAYRGKGIGRKLMEKLLQEARQKNLDEVLLFTGHHRTPAINLYQSLGFALKDSGLYTLKLTEAP
ncbi:GNAT family N-acetyltransferase [Pareuzebyella sediminis]|uniref:GNAT family N-acetyltransferase n=1 Tax=Pareuzebyella sediminis TaxID=2607998 RepID=UPI001E3B5629|nr:GNAT family N-acetyltransferase [Pareuzebyella sediminis]